MAKKSDTAVTHVDPVCGMDVKESEAAGKSTYENETYYFCSQDCKQEFDEDPSDFAG